MNEDQFDPIGALTAATDQLKSEMKPLADARHAVFKAYLDVGFSSEQAFTLMLIDIQGEDAV